VYEQFREENVQKPHKDSPQAAAAVAMPTTSGESLVVPVAVDRDAIDVCRINDSFDGRSFAEKRLGRSYGPSSSRPRSSFSRVIGPVLQPLSLLSRAAPPHLLSASLRNRACRLLSVDADSQ